MIEISSNSARAVIAPDLGGAVMSFDCDGRDILRRAPSHEAVAKDPREAACYPCVPWFSRLPGGLDFNGRHYELAPTLTACDPDHALHGHGWTSAWAVAEKAKDRLACSFDYAPSARGFPFSFYAVQTFRIHQDALRIDLTVFNTGDAPMPAGLGLHPFFPCHDDSEISFNGRKVTLATCNMDDSFSGWDGSASVNSDQLAIELASNAPILHLYAPQKSGFFCAEPVTHMPGRFGETVLNPAESLNIFLEISAAIKGAQ